MSPRPADAHRHVIRVGWGDCDPANIAYTGRLPAFMLESIDAWWEAHLGQGWFQMELDSNLGTPFVRLEMDFKHPVTPRHRLECHVWPARLGETSIAFRVDGVQDGTTCFSGLGVSVFTVADAFRKQPAPQSIRDLVMPLIPGAAG